MVKQVLCCVALLAFTGCGEVVEDDSASKPVHKLEDERFRISPSEQSPVFNVLSYNKTNEPHEVLERNFINAAQIAAKYVVFDYSFTATACDGGQDRAEATMYVVSGDTVRRIESLKPFNLGVAETLRVVVSNPARCENVNLRFAAILL